MQLTGPKGSLGSSAPCPREGATPEHPGSCCSHRSKGPGQHQPPCPSGAFKASPCLLLLLLSRSRADCQALAPRCEVPLPLGSADCTGMLSEGDTDPESWLAPPLKHPTPCTPASGGMHSTSIVRPGAGEVLSQTCEEREENLQRNWWLEGSSCPRRGSSGPAGLREQQGHATGQGTGNLQVPPSPGCSASTNAVQHSRARSEGSGRGLGWAGHRGDQLARLPVPPVQSCPTGDSNPSLLGTPSGWGSPRQAGGYSTARAKHGRGTVGGSCWAVSGAWQQCWCTWQGTHPNPSVPTLTLTR